MEIQYYGGNCVRIVTKKSEIVIDDNLSSLGHKSITKPGDIALFTDINQTQKVEGAKLLINQPGEYEVSDVLIQGVAARAYTDETGNLSSTIFRLSSDDISLIVVGHIYPELSDPDLEVLGQSDVLLIPVGNSGFTLSGSDALKIIKKIEPSIVIPTHYASESIKYSVSQANLSEALKDLAMEPSETLAKLKLKPSTLSEDDTTRLVVLEPGK